MTNFYPFLFKKHLFKAFFLLLVSSQALFAQNAPTDVTPDQIICQGSSITLEATCEAGTTVAWYEDVNEILSPYTVSPIANTTYTAYCVDACNVSSMSVETTITVNENPALPDNITVSQTICEGSSITLAATCVSSNAVWYEDDEVTYLVSTTVSPTEETTYKVRCEDANCNSTFESVTIDINTDIPELPGDITESQIICVGESVDLEASCDTGSPTWYEDDETTSVANLNVSPIVTTTYKVRCEDGTCSSAFESVIITVPNMQAPTGITNDTTVCRGTSVTLTATCATGNARWYQFDETTIIPVNTVFPDSETTYKVRCEEGGCVGTFESVTISTLTDIINQPTSTLVCLGESASFSVVASGTPTYQWQKRNSDGTYSDIADATTSMLTISNTVLSDEGYYRARVMGDCDFFTEDVFLAFPKNLGKEHKVVFNSSSIGLGFRSTVAISDSMAVVGAFEMINGLGKAYIFNLSTAGKWIQTTEIVPLDTEIYDYFGSSVAIAKDTIFIGSPGKDGEAGAVYVFGKDINGNWNQLDKLVASDADTENYFGDGVAVSGNTLVVGADGYDYSTGKAYVFEKNSSGVWVETTTLSSSIGYYDEYFGYNVAISNNTIAISADGTNDDAGAVYIFEKDNSNQWYQKEMLSPGDLVEDDLFGHSLALDNKQLIVGAIGQNSGNGAAYIYKKDVVGHWNQKDKLVPNDLTTQSGFGSSVGILNNHLIVGAFGYNVAKGAAYLYEKDNNGTWIKKTKLAPAGLALGDQFGNSVAISNTSLLVGTAFLVSPFSSVELSSYFYNFGTSPKPTVSSISQVAAVCSGQTATFNVTGIPTTDAYTITYQINNSVDKTVVVTPDSTGKASFTGALVWADNNNAISISKIKNNVTLCESIVNVTSVLAVKIPTAITTQPTAQTTCVGGTAVFMAEAVGEGILTFQWQRQAPISSGMTNAPDPEFAELTMLTLLNRTLADSSAKYRVKVTGECGVVTSNQAMLTVIKKPLASISGGGAICVGGSSTITFTGTSNAEVVYEVNGQNKTILLNGSGTATMATGVLNTTTIYHLVSVNINGTCSQTLSGSATVEVGVYAFNPPVTLTSPTNDVQAQGIHIVNAQTITAKNKINLGGKATYTGNQSLLLSTGFEAKTGSVFVAKIGGGC